MKVLIFIVVMVMANGETQLESRIVNECPNKNAVDTFYHSLYTRGLIKHWGATCFQFHQQGERL